MQIGLECANKVLLRKHDYMYLPNKRCAARFPNRENLEKIAYFNIFEAFYAKKIIKTINLYIYKERGNIRHMKKL